MNYAIGATRVRSALTILGGLLAMQAAHADGTTRSWFNISGFGTAGIVHSDNSDADFVSSVTEGHGAGESARVSAAVDSKLGVQLTLTPRDDLTGVVQIIEQQQWDGVFRPDIEWLNVSYQALPDLDVRLGRIVWPMFVRSESVNVGYANFGVRPSAELNAEMPNTHNDGGDLTYHFRLAGMRHAFTVFGGHSHIHYGDYYPNTTFDVKDVAGASDMIDVGPVTVHAAAMHMRYLYTAPGVTASAVKLPIYSVGAVYDDTDGAFVQGDAQLALDPYYGRMKSLAVIGGYHFGAFSPYVGLSQFTQATFGPGAVPEQTPTQRDTYLGLRWDFHTGWDAKVQYDHVATGDVAGDFPISLIFPNDGQQYTSFLTHARANVMSAVVDFVF